MKKLIVALIACGVTLGGALAQVTQTSAAVDVFTPPHAFRDTIIPAHNKAVVDLAAVIASLNTAIQGSEIVFMTDTNAAVTLTAKVPTGTSMTVLYTPNSTDKVNVVDSDSNTNSTLRRISVNFTTSTNSWIEVPVAEQE